MIFIEMLKWFYQEFLIELKFAFQKSDYFLVPALSQMWIEGKTVYHILFIFSHHWFSFGLLENTHNSLLIFRIYESQIERIFICFLIRFNLPFRHEIQRWLLVDHLTFSRIIINFFESLIIWKKFLEFWSSEVYNGTLMIF